MWRLLGIFTAISGTFTRRVPSERWKESVGSCLQLQGSAPQPIATKLVDAKVLLLQRMRLIGDGA